MATSAEWAVGDARQALADLNGWEALAATELPARQSLHFLQMACEKLAKARLCTTGADPKTLQSSHAYIAKQLPTIVLDELVFEKAKPKVRRDIVKHARRLAREIELLAPAVDAGGKRRDNCEYPWDDATGRLWVPADYDFTASQLLAERYGVAVVKLIRRAIERLAV